MLVGKLGRSVGRVGPQTAAGRRFNACPLGHPLHNQQSSRSHLTTPSDRGTTASVQIWDFWLVHSAYTRCCWYAQWHDMTSLAVSSVMTT